MTKLFALFVFSIIVLIVHSFHKNAYRKTKNLNAYKVLTKKIPLYSLNTDNEKKKDKNNINSCTLRVQYCGGCGFEPFYIDLKKVVLIIRD
jgi:exopolysaccharide biosynthesis predicted pyruvyltransferase EpsI